MGARSHAREAVRCGAGGVRGGSARAGRRDVDGWAGSGLPNLHLEASLVACARGERGGAHNIQHLCQQRVQPSTRRGNRQEDRAMIEMRHDHVREAMYLACIRSDLSCMCPSARGSHRSGPLAARRTKIEVSGGGFLDMLCI